MMAIYNQRIELTKNELANAYSRSDSIWSILYGVIRFIGIIVQNIYCISSYLVLSWIVFFPLNWIRNDLYSRVENCLYNSLLFIVSSWSLAAGSFIVETGDEYKHLIEDLITCPEQSNQANGDLGGELKHHKSNSNTTKHLQTHTANKHRNLISLGSTSDLKANQERPKILFLCNHVSTADVPLIMQSFSTLTNHSILWVLDAQFKLTNFGIVCSSHGDFFVAKNCFDEGSLRDQAIKQADRNLLVLFPEGGFLRKRIEGSNRYALRNGLPQTKYVTHPRFGAFKDLMDPNVGVTHIIDTTLIYDDIENPLSILNIAFGNRKEPIFLHHKVFERKDINPTEEWLRNIWMEKEERLANYYKNRNEFHELFGNTMRTAKLDWFKVLCVHLFYLLVCYLATFRLFTATNVVVLKAKDLYYSNI